MDKCQYLYSYNSTFISIIFKFPSIKKRTNEPCLKYDKSTCNIDDMNHTYIITTALHDLALCVMSWEKKNKVWYKNKEEKTEILNQLQHYINK